MYAKDALNRHPLVFEKDLRRCRHLRRKVRKGSGERRKEFVPPSDRGLELDGHETSEAFLFQLRAHAGEPKPLRLEHGYDYC